ncbi:MAG: hypothetical protein CMJ42_18440 [Phyllobacteriaceae bacterium]|nr:hypothetical protein [Phyllobacteriaceae bacterium]
MKSSSSKPFIVPADDAPDSTYVSVYWQLIGQDPRWLTGLRRDDGSLYLARPAKKQGRAA